MNHSDPVNILLVDDSPANLVALEAALADTGQTLVKAESGLEALRCLLKQDFAVILLDVQMPSLDGFETASLIRERERTKHTPIIFITAIGTTPPDVSRGYAVGAVDYLVKPYDVTILRSKVAFFVELFRLREALRHQADELAATNRQLHMEIQEHRRTTEQLRQLSAHLQSAREDERIRVVREIHDELGQMLTAVRMDLDLIERDLPHPNGSTGPDDITACLRSAKGVVDDSIRKMHEIIRELRPEILDSLGLGEAIEWQAQEFQRRSGIDCQLSIEKETELDRDRSTAVFRIFQEALTNVARHAQATRVQVLLKREYSQIVLTVRDDGRGFDENNVPNSSALGILGMRERALVFGGQVDLQSAPGEGTTVQVNIPLEELREPELERE